MPQVVTMIATPFDPDAVVSIQGPPWPGGAIEWLEGGLNAFDIAGAEVPLHLSDIGYHSHAGDQPPATWFQPRLKPSFNFEADLWRGDEPSGGGSAGAGEVGIILARADVVSPVNVLPAIELVGAAKVPATDGGASFASVVAVTPPADMAEDDYVILVCAVTTGTASLSLTESGGQSWVVETGIFAGGSGLNANFRIFHCRFNGSWTADPEITSSVAGGFVAVMTVWRNVDPITAFDLPLVQAAYAAPGSPYDVTIAGATPRSDGALAIAIWGSANDQTWALQTEGWENLEGAAQWRGGDGAFNDASLSIAVKVGERLVPTGDVTNRQTAFGGQNGFTARIVLRRIAPPERLATDLSRILDYGWDGRPVRFYRGDKTAAFATHELIFDGTPDRIEASDRLLSLKLRDLQAPFQRLLQTSFYGGSGGREGGADLAGQPRPICLGVKENIAPKQIDGSLLIYQWGTGPSQMLDAARDKGGALPVVADYPSFEALASATVGAPGSGADIEHGEVASCLAESLVRAAAPPAGLLTVDVHGSTEGGYIETIGDIAAWIATTRLGPDNFAASDILGLAALNAAQPAAIGYYEDRAGITCAQAMDEVLGKHGAWWYATRLGQLRLGRLDLVPGPADHVWSFANVKDGAWRRGLSKVSEMRRVGWRRLARTQSADELAAPPTVSEADRQLYGEISRYAPAQDPSVVAKHRFARTVTSESLFAAEAAAAAEAARLLALHGTARGPLSFGLAGIDPLSIEPGETVELTFAPFAEQIFLIKRLAIDLSRDASEVELWGPVG